MPYELLKSCFNFTEFFWNSWIWIKVSRKIIYYIAKFFSFLGHKHRCEKSSAALWRSYTRWHQKFFFPMIYKKDLPMIAYFELKIISWKQNKKEEKGKLFDSWEITILHFDLTSFLKFYHLDRSILIISSLHFYFYKKYYDFTRIFQNT